jgi:hypothetical protein
MIEAASLKEGIIWNGILLRHGIPTNAIIGYGKLVSVPPA